MAGNNRGVAYGGIKHGPDPNGKPAKLRKDQQPTEPEEPSAPKDSPKQRAYGDIKHGPDPDGKAPDPPALEVSDDDAEVVVSAKSPQTEIPDLT